MVDVAYLPTMCNHCDEAPCIAAAKDGAITKRPDGIVLIVPEKAKGQKQLVDACPYGAIWWNEESETPQHWPFDAHLLDQGWTETRGAQACATKAMQSFCLEDAEMAEKVKNEGLQVLKPELGTQPRVYYRNLHRYQKAFIGGSLAAEIDGLEECVEGATVKLTHDGEMVKEMISDNYGDFKFDGLDENSGTYKVEIVSDHFAAKTVDVELSESIYLGVITP
jgi:Fe-S-cluster-containing hydrogenase component 2